MNKAFGVFNISKKKYVGFFEFAEQANKFIRRRLNNSPFFEIIELRKE